MRAIHPGVVEQIETEVRPSAHEQAHQQVTRAFRQSVDSAHPARERRIDKMTMVSTHPCEHAVEVVRVELRRSWHDRHARKLNIRTA